MNFETIILDIKKQYAIITLNRPDKLNALNHQLFTELNSAVQEVEKNENLRALIITGSGEKAFAAGADIKELHECNERTGKHFSEYGSNIMARIENLKIPVIAAVNGFALGGGCELAMSCHIRFASENAKFGQPEVNLGIIPGYGGTQRLTRLVGLAKSIELNISGNIIGSSEAKEIGLVNQVYSKEELMDKTLEFVNIIISKSPTAVNVALETVLNSDKLTISDGLAYESKRFGEVCGTEDFKEGTLAFIEKREAKFSGK